MRIKLTVLNLFCLLLLAYVTASSWITLTVRSTLLINDYKTLYRVFHQHEGFYKRSFYTADFKGENVKQKKMTFLDALNINTPLMSSALYVIINLSNQLMTNALIWTLLSLAAVTISVFLAMRYVNSTHAKLGYLIPLVTVFWLSWPSLSNQYLGQVAFLLLPVFVWAFCKVSQKQWCTAAVLLGLLAACKVFFLLFVLFFALIRSWRALGIFILSFLALFFLPVIWLSWDTYLAFFHVIHAESAIYGRILIPINGSLIMFGGYLALMAGVSDKLDMSFGIYYVLSIYVFGAWLIYTTTYLKKLPAYSAELIFCFTTVLMLLLSPLAWLYYFVFLLVPVLVFFKIAKQMTLSTSFYIWFYLGLLIPVFSALPGENMFWLTLKFNAAWMGLLCWLPTMHFAAKEIMKPSINTGSHIQKLTTIVSAYAITALILLGMQFGMPFFLGLNKEALIKSTPANTWVVIKSNISNTIPNVPKLADDKAVTTSN